MDTQTIKAAIYKLLDETEDNEVLEDVQDYLSQRRAGIIPELGCTLEEYNRDLDEAVEEMARGEYVSHKEAMRQVDDMLQQKRLQHEANLERQGTR